uniref:Putative secreted protein n=1 Tax=Anopheles marajoara TaxID=58244 RepID=A0A2M4CE57_9DIPT
MVLVFLLVVLVKCNCKRINLDHMESKTGGISQWRQWRSWLCLGVQKESQNLEPKKGKGRESKRRRMYGENRVRV